MFAVVTALCVWLAVQVNRAHEQRSAVAAIRRMGGEVYYDYHYKQIDGETSLAIDAQPTAPAWLLRWLGEDYLYRAVAVTPKLAHFSGGAGAFLGPALVANDFSNRTDEALEHIGRLRNLRILDLKSTQVSGAGLAHLKHLDKLRHLALPRMHVTQADVDELRTALPNCSIVR
jgi:hypothetical protein